MDKKFVLRAVALSLSLALSQASPAAGDDDLLFSFPLSAEGARFKATAPVDKSATAAEDGDTARFVDRFSPSAGASQKYQNARAQQEEQVSLSVQKFNVQTGKQQASAASLSRMANDINTEESHDESLDASLEESADIAMGGPQTTGAPPRPPMADIPPKRDAAIKARANNGTIHAWFQQMVGAALEHSPEVRASLSDMDASSWGVKQVQGQRYPQVQLGSSAPFGAFGGSKSTRNNNSISDTSASVSVSTTVFDWGKISSDIDSAKEGLSASALIVKETREQIASSTMTELLNLSRYKESLLAAKAYVKRMNELVTMLSGIASVDKGRASEQVQAQARLLSAQAEQERLQHMYDNTRIRLVRLMGREPVLPNYVRWDGDLVSLNTALNALPEHPTLKRNEAEVRAADAQAESIKANGLPKVNWVIQKSTAKDTNGDEDGWYTGLNVQWNAFSGGSERAARQSALAKMRTAQERQQTSRYELEYQIRNMVETRDSSLVRANSYVKLSAETDRVRDMFYRQWYHLGTRTLLDVLTAESDHFNNQLSAINNYYDGYISNVSVMYSAAILLNWLANQPGSATKAQGIHTQT